MKDTLAYFLDKDTFEIKDCIQIKIKEINLDLETNGNSSFSLVNKINVEEGDFIFIKDINYFGIILNQVDDGKNGLYNLTCKHALSMLDFESFVENEVMIKEIGIEDFLVNRIKEEFVTNTDSFCNKTYLSAHALTHTTKQISIENLVTVNNEIYNFLTLLENAIEKYDLKCDFVIDDDKLKINISQNTSNKVLIDTTLSDVVDYEETFSLTYITKVECLALDTGIKYYKYLLNDRTTTSDNTNPNRVKGTTKRIITNKTEDVEQAIADVFKGNSYEHYISFKIVNDTKLINISDLKLGTPIQIKTKNNVINDTYISKIKKNNNKFIEFTCGNMRVDFIDKILKEKRGK